MHRTMSGITDYNLTDPKHQGTVRSNAPLKWELCGHDGNYTATLSGGDAKTRIAALDETMRKIGGFTDIFGDRLGRDERSYFTQRATNLTGENPPLEATLTISYVNKGPCDGFKTQAAMREFIQGCLVTDMGRGVGA